MPVEPKKQNDPQPRSEQQQPGNPNFTGRVSVNMLVNPDDGLNCTMGCVSFDPGARTNWHSHPGGQILFVTEGSGYCQEKGMPERKIYKGDVVICRPDIIHWHGAAADSGMTHLATGPNYNSGSVVWLGKVSDSEYNEVQ